MIIAHSPSANELKAADCRVLGIVRLPAQVSGKMLRIARRTSGPTSETTLDRETEYLSPFLPHPGMLSLAVAQHAGHGVLVAELPTALERGHQRLYGRPVAQAAVHRNLPSPLYGCSSHLSDMHDCINPFHYQAVDPALLVPVLAAPNAAFIG